MLNFIHIHTIKRGTIYILIYLDSIYFTRITHIKWALEEKEYDSFKLSLAGPHDCHQQKWAAYYEDYDIISDGKFKHNTNTDYHNDNSCQDVQ